MANTHDDSASMTLSARVAQGLHTYWKIILYILAGVVVLTAALAVYSVISERRSEAGILIAEELQETYAEWLNAGDEERAGLESAIGDLVASIQKEYSGTFAHQRSLLIEGNFAYEQERWDDAAASFSRLADLFPKSYLAPVALMNQAAALEENGKSREAVEIYQKVVDTYSEISPDAPRALFSIARLYEKTGQNESAHTAYSEVVETFPDSDWTKLARDRIIYLETR